MKKTYDQKKVVGILTKLISYNTVTGNNQEIEACLKYVASLIPDDKYSALIITNEGVPNLYVKSRSGNNNILFNGHIDVVPADPSQFKAVVKGNKLYGRGAIDMKGAVAAMIVTLQNLDGYDLLLTGDEEIGGKNGMGCLVKSKSIKSYEYAITGEPTGLVVATEEKGVMWLTATLDGKSCHAAKPWEGINPLYKLDKILNHLKNGYNHSREAWETTVTPTIIKSNNGQNQIPEHLEVRIDCRYIPGDDPKAVVKGIKKLVDQVDITNLEPPLSERPSPYTDALVQLSQKPVGKMHWATDARYFEDIPVAIYGPIGEGMHSTSEYVELSSMETMYHTLSQLISNLG